MTGLKFVWSDRNICFQGGTIDTLEDAEEMVKLIKALMPFLKSEDEQA